MNKIDDNNEMIGEEIMSAKDKQFSWHTAAVKSAFVAIDREQEDKDVSTFQKTKDTQLFDKVYKARIPTLQIWARRYSYLVDSKEDMFGECSYCFTKAVLTYKKSKGAFNTWLFRLLINCIQNIKTSRQAKKRLPKGQNPNSMHENVLSLDYSYDGKDGSQSTMKDAILQKRIDAGPVNESPLIKMSSEETINILSNHNKIVRGFLIKVSDGNTISSLLKEYKSREGKINITKDQFDQLNVKKKQKKIVYALIKENGFIQGDFKVLDYKVIAPHSLLYTIEMKKTKESDLVMKTIRKLRKDNGVILAKIKKNISSYCIL
jgi:DNA-directed RNA polymerase specialized sigma24 family protein